MSSSGVQHAKSRSHDFDKPTRQLSKAASMDPLPSYRPLTPVQVLVPVPVHSPLLSTPPPSSPTPLPCMTNSDIPLIPITPPKSRYPPSADLTRKIDPSGLPTPPLTGKFPAISSFNPTTSNHPVGGGPRPASPSPTRGTSTNSGLSLSSRNLSSLSLSPRSLAMSHNKRSKSLGGVAVKKITPPKFNFVVAQPEDVQEDAAVEATCVFSTTLSRDGEKSTNGTKSALVPLPVRSPRFLLNFSSSSLSSSRHSLPSEPISPPPFTGDFDSPPSSAPLETPRSINASYSFDIAKPCENEPLLPHPIPLMDTDINADCADMGMVLGDYGKHVPPAWSSDHEEEQAVVVARVLEDFDVDVADEAVDTVYTGAKATSVGVVGMKVVEGRLVELEGVEGRFNGKTMRQNMWVWDDDDEVQGNGWGADVNDENTKERGRLTGSERVVSADVIENVVHGAGGVMLNKEVSNNVEAEADLAEGTAVEYPDLDLLPLPETVDVVPPAISICTQDAVLCKDQNSEWESVLSSSVERATPISWSQTPTPPASPPREVRMSSLPKASKSLQGQIQIISVATSPVAKSPVVATVVDIEAAQETEEVDVSPPVVDQEDEDISISVDMPSPPPPYAGPQGEEEQAEDDKIVVLLDKPLVSSPASISSFLPEGEEDGCGITFTFESDGDKVQRGSGDELGVEVVPPSPSGFVQGWNYGSSDEEELEQSGELEESAGIQAPVHVQVNDDGQGRGEGDKPDIDESNLPCVGDVQAPETVSPGDEVVQDIQEPELALEPSSLSQDPALPSPSETVREAIVLTQPTTTALWPPSLQPSTSLPGSFPDAAASPKQEIKPESVPNDTPSSPQPQIRRRIRTPLEEAIARTRSPLEVALAMQLRPGLGVGADPAWMVRFMMVMWGWMFGLALAPSTA